MHPIRKTVIDKFQEHLLNAYYAYCQKHQLEGSIEGLLVFLIDQDLIPPPQIKRLAVFGEYTKLSAKQKNKTSIVKDISSLMNISERHTWSLLKYELERQNKK